MMYVVPREIRGCRHGLPEKGGCEVGAIRKRGKNYIITFYDASGKRRWETVGPNLHEARQVLDKRMWERRRNGAYSGHRDHSVRAIVITCSDPRDRSSERSDARVI